MRTAARSTCLLMAFVAHAAVVWAEAPDRSQRPQSRPGAAGAEGVAVFAGPAVLRPQLRPSPIGADTAQPALIKPAARPLPTPVAPVTPPPVNTPGDKATEGAIILAVAEGLQSSLRPLVRPKSIAEGITQRTLARSKGRLCSTRGIEGSPVGRVRGSRSGCGVKSAVRVTAISGVALSSPATMDCTTAKALKSWVEKGMRPALGNKGGGVKTINVIGHYACRTRNNLPGAKISEHGKGRAIDIAGFTLRDGSKITLLRDWGRGAAGRALRKMHRAACGPFGTVLGPEANRFHRDHFHFDTARYRSGAYCR